MKIALFSDIHANLPALKAVFLDMEERQPDVIYCLGDLVGYAPWPNEVVREIRQKHIPVIAGNYDRGIGLNSDDCGCAYKTDKEKSMGAVSISFTNREIGESERQYLKSLPAYIDLKFHFDSQELNVVLVHGSPRKINEYLFEDRPDSSFLCMMQQANADIMAFGHTHKPFHKKIFEQDDQNHIRHAINIGSVGKPKDNDPRACYALIDIQMNKSSEEREGVHVEFIRVEYDLEKTVKAIKSSPLPDEYAEMLEKAY